MIAIICNRSSQDGPVALVVDFGHQLDQPGLEQAVAGAAQLKRQAQRGTAAAQRQAPVRDREHGSLPGHGGGRCTHSGALQPIGRRAGHAVPVLERPGESCRRDHAPRAAPCGELVELTRASARAPSRGDGVVRQHELRHRNDGEAHGTQPPLDLELDLQHETAGIDHRAEAARRLGVAAEDVTRLELGHARLAPCYTRDLQQQRATIVHGEPQPAGRTPPVQVAVGRIEVQIAVERAPGRPSTEGEW